MKNRRNEKMNWMSGTFWVLLAILFLAVVLGLAFRNPREDWPFNRKNTLILLGTCTVFLAIMILVNVVKKLVDWPAKEILLFGFLLVSFLVLVVLGVFVPRGIRRD